ncbi:hypothetical protein Fcan01_15287 [Folsomia candida]|uniref:Helitron helicase-like domain-containing protein n=1 Tax=Folsomia candida TaxID=158441 RepID=A0A226E0S2_FOLCA|nr:hypothetical protein Fcan01_15287 [Folsomia candida]
MDNPSQALVNLADVTYFMIKNAKSRCKSKKSNNPTHKNSIWRYIESSLLGTNEPNIRQFLHNFEKCIPLQNSEKYYDTTVNMIRIFMMDLASKSELNNNHRQPSSSWGLLSTNIYTTNTMDDRRFLSQLWAIGNELDNIEGESLDALLHKTVRIRDKRKEKLIKDQNRYQHNLQQLSTTISPAPQNIEDDLIVPSQTSQVELIELLDKLYKKSIQQYATQPCDNCMLLMYPSQARNISITPQLFTLFGEIDVQYQLPPQMKVCQRCKNNLKKFKIPPKSKINGMALPPIPKELECLSMAETRLISQVKPHMKVFHTCRGQGQRAIKGLVVHFPQQIKEVVDQLPMTTENSDFIVVNETNDKTDLTTQLRVRPKKVYEALRWLKDNNPLYRNDKCLFLGAHSARATPYFSIMLASNAPQWLPAYAAIESPLTWTRETLDGVLLTGNEYYSLKQEDVQHDYLTADEVTGDIIVFGGCQVSLGIGDLSNAVQFDGYVNRARSADLPRLDYQIRQFLTRGCQFGILTIGLYSMAMYVEGNLTYYFDSHSRGKAGGATRGEDAGAACVLKIDNDLAPAKISNLANRNCVSTSIPRTDLVNLRFLITVFNVVREEQISSNPSTPIPSPTNSPPRKIPRPEIFAPDSDEGASESEDEDQEGLAFPSAEFGRVLDMDCVIERDDIMEPDLDDVIDGRYELNRIYGGPLNEHHEQNLDLLAFPNLFPHGVNGLHAFRKIPITYLDYFQQRIMSSEKRFSRNTDFLFYALSETDKYRARQKIAICCHQKLQGDPNGQEDNLAARDPHVYMSAIRGTSAFWRKYTGDLIAMVKSLGVPTFFFTFSYDDLNSSDSVNALLKAKNGADTPECDPSTIPYDERKQMLNDDPVTAARHFSMRLTKFIALIKANGQSIFGLPLIDYSIRVEFQARGSPHAHCLFWLENAPDWNSSEGIALLERNISCSVSGQYSDLVLRYQKHCHKSTCFKNRNSSCRFAFPRVASSETKILNDDEIARNRGRFFALKRVEGEEMIGYYHPVLFPILRCNMDLQPVTNAMAIAYYIAKYMSKAEPLEIRQDVKAAISKIHSSNLPAAQKMFRVAMTIMRHREVGAQEAAFRNCHLFLRYSSRASVFLPTFMKDKRVRMVDREYLA